MGLLITDPGAPAVRVTRDVDVLVEAVTRTDFFRIEKDLRSKGFRQEAGDEVICRWRMGDLILDVMPSSSGILGFGNRWYPEVLSTATSYVLPDESRIRLASPPAFLATKLEAFLSRGGGDFLGSRDLEDVVALLDGRPSLLAEVAASRAELRTWIAKTVARFAEDPEFPYALQGHLPPDAGSQARLGMLRQRVQDLIDLGS